MRNLCALNPSEVVGWLTINQQDTGISDRVEIRSLQQHSGEDLEGSQKGTAVIEEGDDESYYISLGL